MALGNSIGMYRRKLGLTQEGLAQKLNVTNQAVSKWETDQSCPDTMLLPLMPEKSLFQSLQQKGVILFDDNAAAAKLLTSYELRQKKTLMEIMSALFDSIEFA